MKGEYIIMEIKYKLKDIKRIGSTVLLDCNEHGELFVASREIADLSTRTLSMLELIKNRVYNSREDLYRDVNNLLIDVAPTTWCTKKHITEKALINMLLGVPSRKAANDKLHLIGDAVTTYDVCEHEIEVEEIVINDEDITCESEIEGGND